MFEKKVKVNICYSAPSRLNHRRGAQVHGAHEAASHIPALKIVLYHLFIYAVHVCIFSNYIISISIIIKAGIMD